MGNQGCWSERVETLLKMEEKSIQEMREDNHKFNSTGKRNILSSLMFD